MGLSDWLAGPWRGLLKYVAACCKKKSKQAFAYDLVYQDSTAWQQTIQPQISQPRSIASLVVSQLAIKALDLIFISSTLKDHACSVNSACSWEDRHYWSVLAMLKDEAKQDRMINIDARWWFSHQQKQVTLSRKLNEDSVPTSTSKKNICSTSIEPTKKLVRSLSRKA